jgi:hypothetical protein
MGVGRQLAREIAQDCQETLLKFMGHIDAAEYGEMEKYFAAEGVWRRIGGDINGVDALRAVFSKRPQGLKTRHIVTNFVTTVVSEDRATVQSCITAYRHDPGADPDAAAVKAPRRISSCTVLSCRDELVKVGDVWKISFRQATPQFELEAS